MARDIVSKATRTEFREWLSANSVLGQISNIFDSAGVEYDSEYEPSMAGSRRGLVEQYYHSVDWTDRASVQTVLDAYKHILIFMPPEDRAKFEMLLRSDGFVFEGARLIPAKDELNLEETLAEIADSLDLGTINDQVSRLRGAVDEDPALAIGTAKELLESICKGIAEKYGVVLDGKEDIPLLVKHCLKCLRMSREDIPDDKKGAAARKQIASGLAGACQGIAELRNVYGTGHGRGSGASKATTRDARLAVGTATTLGVFLAEVYDAQQQLARRKGAGSEGVSVTDA